MATAEACGSICPGKGPGRTNPQKDPKSAGGIVEYCTVATIYTIGLCYDMKTDTSLSPSLSEEAVIRKCLLGGIFQTAPITMSYRMTINLSEFQLLQQPRYIFFHSVN